MIEGAIAHLNNALGVGQLALDLARQDGIPETWEPGPGRAPQLSPSDLAAVLARIDKAKLDLDRAAECLSLADVSYTVADLLMVIREARELITGTRPAAL